ncbi:hypothetical protein RV05_GL001710 [Enterococcus hirae]|nr:hypothetical protein RV05_GL001710 [Enterococcus hirae]
MVKRDCIRNQQSETRKMKNFKANKKREQTESLPLETKDIWKKQLLPSSR